MVWWCVFDNVLSFFLSSFKESTVCKSVVWRNSGSMNARFHFLFALFFSTNLLLCASWLSIQCLCQFVCTLYWLIIAICLQGVGIESFILLILNCFQWRSHCMTLARSIFKISIKSLFSLLILNCSNCCVYELFPFPSASFRNKSSTVSMNIRFALILNAASHFIVRNRNDRLLT